MKFYIIDAFAEELFGGNPAGVVILDKGTEFPEESIMIKTASELRYSETAFVKQLSDEEFNIRYFTPVAEVELCGHATIASFGALIEEGIAENGKTYDLFTKAGKLEISINEGQVLMEMGKPQDFGPATEVEELAEALGVKTQDIGMTPKLVSTGLPDIMVNIKKKETLMNMIPDFSLMAKLSKKLNVVGVHAFSLAGEGSQVMGYCRNFAPLYGIDEEAATGTANGALTYYLYKEKIIEKGKSNTFVQGESMGRPSKIFTMIDQNEPIKVRIGGFCKVLAKGELLI